MKEKTSFLSTDADLKGMVSALRDAKCFKVVVDAAAGTAVASHAACGQVFSAVQKPSGHWIVRCNSDLFA